MKGNKLSVRLLLLALLAEYDNIQDADWLVVKYNKLIKESILSQIEGVCDRTGKGVK